MAKQPTHSDLMKKIEDLEKRLAKLEPKDDLVEFRKILDEIKKVMPEKEYVPYYPFPYTYPWYPGTGYPWYPITPIFTCGTNTTESTSTDIVYYS